MAIQQPRMMLEQFLTLPEQKPALEFEPDGTVIHKMSRTGKHSRLQWALLRSINGYSEPPKLAVAFTELRTVFGGAAYVPDVSVYRWHRPPLDAGGEVADNFLEPPDIAIEVASPEQSVNSLARRLVRYVENGVKLALVVDPYGESVLLFRRGASPTVIRGTDRIALAEVLPNFELTAEQMFASLDLERLNETDR
jgi:Uma2 family endonuclease